MIIAQSHSDDSATAPCMSRCMHFAQARPPMSCIPLVIYDFSNSVTAIIST